MICKGCGKEMYLDDRDYRFKGNLDKYWECENCHSSCIEEIRYSQSFKEHWTIRNEEYQEDKFKKFTIKHNIDTTLRIKKGEL